MAGSLQYMINWKFRIQKVIEFIFVHNNKPLPMKNDSEQIWLNMFLMN